MSDGNSESGRRPDDRGTLPADRERRSDFADPFGGLTDEEGRAAISEHVTGSWRRTGQSRAEGLVTGATDERPPADERAHPWTPGLHMDVRARGALVSRDRELHRSVGHGGYANQVYGNRHVKSGFEHLRLLQGSASSSSRAWRASAPTSSRTCASGATSSTSQRTPS